MDYLRYMIEYQRAQAKNFGHLNYPSASCFWGKNTLSSMSNLKYLNKYSVEILTKFLDFD